MADETKKADETAGMTSFEKELAKCKQVTLVLPIDGQNPRDKIVTVQINGNTLTFERGKEITVADVVKDILKRGGYLGTN